MKKKHLITVNALYRPFCIGLVLLLSSTASSHAAPQPGTLDPHYGSGGVVTTTFGDLQPSVLGDAALQADGKLVVAGSGKYGGTDAYVPFVVRYNTNGSLDTTFGNGGIVETHFQQDPNTPDSSNYSAVAVQADGKILAGGIGNANSLSFYYSDPILARYNPDGSLDTTFGINGQVYTNTGAGTGFYANGSMQIFHLQLLADGSFYAIGGNGDRTLPGNPVDRPAMIIKYSAGGQPETIIFPNYTPTDWRKFFSQSVLQADGKLVVNLLGGGYGGADVITDFVLMRFNSDLTFDTTFGSGGVVVTDFGTGTEQANGLALDPNGKITASGSSASANNTGNFYAARYKSNGRLDRTFGNSGKVVITPSSSPFINIEGQRMVRQADGKYDVALGGRYGGLGAVRLLSNGSLDPSFGVSGVANYQTNDANFSYPTIYGNGGSIFLQDDGKILLPATNADNLDNLNGIKILRLLNRVR